jgi:hypothetical protein
MRQTHRRWTLTALTLASLALGCLPLSQAGVSGHPPHEASPPEVRRATFEVRHELKVMVPQGAQRVRIWFVLPQEDPVPGDGDGPAQRVSQLTVEAPYPYRVERDSDGSQVLYLEAQQPAQDTMTVVETFVLTRAEVRHRIDPARARPLSAADRERLAADLAPNTHVVIDDEIRQLAHEIVGDETNPVLAARQLYNWVLHNVDYWVKDPQHKKASPVGSTTYCLTFRTGNCTDFESLWTSLARAAGIPTRIVYGSFFKPELNGYDLDQSYHCWAAFYAPGLGWIPHDVAVADLYAGEIAVTPDNERLMRLTTADGTFGPDPARVDYYFGNLDERRLVWSIGRDLRLTPPQEAGPVNALPKAYVEVDGKVHPEGTGWVRKLTYRERQSR